MLDAFNSDHSDVELVASESEYDDVSDVSKSTSGHGTDSESRSSASTSVHSLLSVLRAPKLSDLTRKRKIQSKPTKRKKIRSSSSTSLEPKSVRPQDWIKRFPSKQLSISAGRLLK